MKKSPAALAEDIGLRLKKTRLNLNLTQAQVASRSGVTRKTLINAEKGKVQLETLLAIMMALEITDQIEQFLPTPPLSPVQLAKLRGKQRQRASRLRAPNAESTPSW